MILSMNGRGYLKSPKGTEFLNWDRKLTENNPVAFFQDSSQGNRGESSVMLRPGKGINAL